MRARTSTGLPASITPTPLEFPLRRIVDLQCAVPPLADGKHTVEVVVRTRPFGEIKLKVEDAISAETQHLTRIPRNRIDDYSADAVHERQAFVERFAGATLDHVRRFSFDAHAAQGNCEHFSGVAQIPLGFAGPLRVNGEHAQGDFLIPLATSEGTLVASYDRGMKVLNLSGGVMCTVVADAMQRAPVFVFRDARGARDFVKWVQGNRTKIAEEAESTSRVAKLREIDCYLSNKFAYAVQLTGTPRARTWWAAPPSPRARGSWSTSRRCAGSTSSRTSPPTRRRRRSTS
jgi:hydroxymethylglutaryl-CoA reductase (NADPH)